MYAIRSYYVEGVTVNNLYEKYPDFFIDVPEEQRLLLENDIIIWHHPFYWYSAPAILKEWMDLVLQHGFAYRITSYNVCYTKLLRGRS